MAFTAQDVKKLREMTNVGMMDCKKALQATDGDMDKAVDWLREKGLAKAAKKADRIAAEGVAYATVIDGVGVVIEVNSETDQKKFLLLFQCHYLSMIENNFSKLSLSLSDSPCLLPIL